MGFLASLIPNLMLNFEKYKNAYTYAPFSVKTKHFGIK